MPPPYRIDSLKELRAFLKEDINVNDWSWRRPGFQAMVVHRFGVYHLCVKNKAYRWFLNKIYKLIHEFVRNFYGIEIYAETKIGRRLRVAHQSGIIIHQKAIIGDDCLIRQGVSIGRGPNHGGGTADAAPTLGNRVEIGANTVLVGGIKIGDDVVIGPCTVVMRNVPSGSIVASQPGRIMTPPSAKTPNAASHEN